MMKVLGICHKFKKQLYIVKTNSDKKINQKRKIEDGANVIKFECIIIVFLFFG